MTQITPLPFKRVIFIHGVGLCADAWNGMLPYFEKDDSVALDLPGHGEASAQIAETMDDMVNALANDTLKGSLVIGHSIGALITLEILARNSSEIAGAVLISPIYQRSENAKTAVRKRADALLAGENNPEPTLDRWFGQSYHRERDETRNWLENGGSGYASAYRIFADYEDLPQDTLAQINTPVLLITGADDPNSTPKMTQNLSQALTHATARIIPNAAHMLTMTHPEITTQLIFDWAKGARHDT